MLTKCLPEICQFAVVAPIFAALLFWDSIQLSDRGKSPTPIDFFYQLFDAVVRSGHGTSLLALYPVSLAGISATAARM